MRKNTRDQILSSALKLFSERGFLGATTKEIARQAGISEVTLFRHFSNKEKLFISVLNKYAFLPILRELILKGKDKPIRDTLIDIAKAFLRELQNNKALVRIMQAEIKRYPDPIKKVYKSLIDDTIGELAQFFNESQDKGEIVRLDPFILAQAFLGLFYSYFLCIEMKESMDLTEYPEDLIINTYVDVFLQGILLKGG